MRKSNEDLIAECRADEAVRVRQIREYGQSLVRRLNNGNLNSYSAWIEIVGSKPFLALRPLERLENITRIPQIIDLYVRGKMNEPRAVELLCLSFQISREPGDTQIQDM